VDEGWFDDVTALALKLDRQRTMHFKKIWVEYRSAWVQALAVVVTLAALGWLVHNAITNLAARNIASGFGFLKDTAGFAISEGLLPYDMEDSYLRAFFAGVANTLRAALPAVVLASVLGFIVGVAQVSKHPVWARVARLYVDVVRNIPLLVQVLLWYFALTHLLPSPELPMQWWSRVFLSKGGLSMPEPELSAAFWLLWVVTGAALWIGVVGVKRNSGPLAILVGCVTAIATLAAWWLAPVQWTVPAPTAFGMTGGVVVSPEWLALVAALSLYGAAYCAEVVRAGLEAVPRGQWESGHALGLSWTQTLVRVVLPQGLRVMVPPYTSLIMNTVKNSSLAVAIGYPDIVSVATTAMNQNGQAIECIAVIAGVYLSLNLVTALVMGRVNRNVQINER